MADVYSSLNTLCRTISRETDLYNDRRDPVVLENLDRHVELLYRHLLVLPEVNNDSLCLLGQLIGTLRTICENSDSNENDQRRAVSFTATTIGRPRFDIEQDQLEYLLDLRFTCSHIATLLGVSLRTIRRRMEEFGISVRDRYSAIADAELDEEIREIKRYYPNAGIKIVTGNYINIRTCILIIINITIYQVLTMAG
jgi:hypothetical protein